MEILNAEWCQDNITKRQTRGYKSKCPSCDGNDLWVTEDTGSAFCFECGVTYRLSNAETLLRAEDDGSVFDIDTIRLMYHTVNNYYRDALSERHRQYLYNRGIDNTAIDIFQFGYCPEGSLPLYRDDVAYESGLASRTGEPRLANRITIPYMADNAITDMRGRGDDPKYKSLLHKAYKRGAIFPFNYDRAIEKSKETGTIIITEGEIKAVLADLHGFAAVALPGMQSWRKGFMSPDKETRIIAVFDSSRDPKDNMRVSKVLYKLSKKIQNMYVGVLPLLGEDKQDIDSFLLHQKGGYDRFKRIIDGSVLYDRYVELTRV